VTSDPTQRQVTSKQRVIDHGEVYTAPREVNAMLDLVEQETVRIESRFLEPACGHGNFLVAVLERKLSVVASRYAKSQLDYERYAVLAVSSLYGIDILPDNVQACRDRLLGLFVRRYTLHFGDQARLECTPAVCYILGRNIVLGDALSLKTVGGEPIVFPEWSLVKGSMIKRRDFTYEELIPSDEPESTGLFDARPRRPRSDLGGTVFIPTPIREYPLVHFLKVADVEQHELQP
jgi:hypothetical protein